MTSKSWSGVPLPLFAILIGTGCPGGTNPYNGMPDAATGLCPSGSVQLAGTVLDGCATHSEGTNVPLPGVQVSTLQSYSSTVSDSRGQFVACLPPGQPTTLQFSLATYVTTYLAEVSLTASPPPGNELLFEMLCNSLVKNYAAEEPTFTPSKASVFVSLNTGSSTGIQQCASDAGEGNTTWPKGELEGWSFSAAGATSYLDESGNLQAVAASFDTGEAVVYNIDPSAQYVRLAGVNPALDVQFPLANSALGLTGRIYVAGEPSATSPGSCPDWGAFSAHLAAAWGPWAAARRLAPAPSLRVRARPCPSQSMGPASTGRTLEPAR